MEKAQLEEKMKGVPQELHRIIDFRTPAMAHPNRVIFGFGAADQVGAEAAKMVEGKKALIISDEVL